MGVRRAPENRAFAVLIRDAELAEAVAAGIRARVDVPVLAPPADHATLHRLAAWWDGQRTGVELSAATLVLVDASELAGLGRIAYVAVPPGSRAYAGDRVVEVAAGTVRDLVDAVAPGEPTADARPLWGRTLVRTAVLTGAIGFGGWLLTTAFQPGQAQADTVHHQSTLDKQIRKQVADRLREGGLDRLPQITKSGHTTRPGHHKHPAAHSNRDQGDHPSHGKPGARHAQAEPGARHAHADAGARHEHVEPGARHTHGKPGARHAHADSGAQHEHVEPGARHAHVDAGARHQRAEPGRGHAETGARHDDARGRHAKPGTRHAHAEPEHRRHAVDPSLDEAARSARDAARLTDRIAGEDSPAAQAAHRAARFTERMAKAAHHADESPALTVRVPDLPDRTIDDPALPVPDHDVDSPEHAADTPDRSSEEPGPPRDAVDTGRLRREIHDHAVRDPRFSVPFPATDPDRPHVLPAPTGPADTPDIDPHGAAPGVPTTEMPGLAEHPMTVRPYVAPTRPMTPQAPAPYAGTPQPGRSEPDAVPTAPLSSDPTTIGDPENPAASPTDAPILSPTGDATTNPTGDPDDLATAPTDDLAAGPADDPAVSPTGAPAVSPSGNPVAGPSGDPFAGPTGDPALSPPGGTTPTSATSLADVTNPAGPGLTVAPAGNQPGQDAAPGMAPPGQDAAPSRDMTPPGKPGPGDQPGQEAAPADQGRKGALCGQGTAAFVGGFGGKVCGGNREDNGHFALTLTTRGGLGFGTSILPGFWQDGLPSPGEGWNFFAGAEPVKGWTPVVGADQACGPGGSDCKWDYNASVWKQRKDKPGQSGEPGEGDWRAGAGACVPPSDDCSGAYYGPTPHKLFRETLPKGTAVGAYHYTTCRITPATGEFENCKIDPGFVSGAGTYGAVKATRAYVKGPLARRIAAANDWRTRTPGAALPDGTVPEAGDVPRTPGAEPVRPTRGPYGLYTPESAPVDPAVRAPAVPEGPGLRAPAVPEGPGVVPGAGDIPPAPTGPAPDAADPVRPTRGPYGLYTPESAPTDPAVRGPGLPTDPAVRAPGLPESAPDPSVQAPGLPESASTDPAVRAPGVPDSAPIDPAAPPAAGADPAAPGSPAGTAAEAADGGSAFMRAAGKVGKVAMVGGKALGEAGMVLTAGDLAARGYSMYQDPSRHNVRMQQAGMIGDFVPWPGVTEDIQKGIVDEENGGATAVMYSPTANSIAVAGKLHPDPHDPDNVDVNNLPPRTYFIRDGQPVVPEADDSCNCWKYIPYEGVPDQYAPDRPVPAPLGPTPPGAPAPGAPAPGAPAPGAPAPGAAAPGPPDPGAPVVDPPAAPVPGAPIPADGPPAAPAPGAPAPGAPAPGAPAPGTPDPAAPAPGAPVVDPPAAPVPGAPIPTDGPPAAPAPGAPAPDAPAPADPAQVTPPPAAPAPQPPAPAPAAPAPADPAPAAPAPTPEPAAPAPAPAAPAPAPANPAPAPAAPAPEPAAPAPAPADPAPAAADPAPAAADPAPAPADPAPAPAAPAPAPPPAGP